MSAIKVMFICPNPRDMSLIPPVAALFYSIFTKHGIEMRFFDTTFYEVSNTYANPNKYDVDALNVEKYVAPTEDQAVYSKPRDRVFVDFRREMEDFQPDVLMVSAMEATISFSREMLRSVRDFGVPTVLGGVFATYAPRLAIACEEIDMVCVGEAENIIVPLVKRIKAGERVSDLPGMCVYDKNGDISQSPIAPPIDLNENPRFDASIFDGSRFFRPMAGEVYRMFPVETHRGCPLVCSFCNSPVQNEMYKEQTGSRYFRGKTVKKVIEDVQYFVEEMNAGYLFFWADNFLAYSKEEIDQFCKEISEFDVPFYVQSYPTTLNKYKIEKLAEAGLDRLGMGLEHGNETFRREIVNRSYSNQKAVEQTAILRKFDFTFSLNNIVGFPTETPELHMDTVHLNRRINPHTSKVSIFTPFHGTPLRDFSVKKGYLKDAEMIAPTYSEQSILDMPQFTKDQISGKARTFNLYLKFPENRWKDIQRAESLTQEGDRILSELKQEFGETYSDSPSCITFS
ncbi:MAG: radical SAM protein [Candidatus Thermoplasmatota archaeon]|nr:radical SAM protein [Candidatus Thermoplasmatota archaeon]